MDCGNETMFVASDIEHCPVLDLLALGNPTTGRSWRTNGSSLPGANVLEHFAHPDTPRKFVESAQSR